jgi:hypothetical protein
MCENETVLTGSGFGFVGEREKRERKEREGKRYEADGERQGDVALLVAGGGGRFFVRGAGENERVEERGTGVFRDSGLSFS